MTALRLSFLLLFATSLSATDLAAPSANIEDALLLPRSELVRRLQQEEGLAFLFRLYGDEEASVRFGFRADVYRELLGLLPDSATQ